MSDEDDNVIELADGTRINTRTGRPIRKPREAPPGFVQVPTHVELQNREIARRRRIADLPDAPERMHVVAVVATYYMYGLSDDDIAIAIGCTLEQVLAVKQRESFTKLVDSLTTAVVENNSADARNYLSSLDMRAAQKMEHLLESEDEKIAVTVAKDILDRAGHRPADIVEHRHSVEGGLIIEHVRKSAGANDDTPIIDLDALEG